MAYNEIGLRRMTYGGASGSGDGSVGSYWDYATTDAASVVEGSGYFNSATTHLKKGDVINARMALGGTPVKKEYIVTSATGAATVVIAIQAPAVG